RDALVQASVWPDVAGAPDDRALDENAPPHVRRGVHDRAGGARMVAQRDAVREYGVGADGGLRRDAAVVSYERRALDGLEIPELDAFAHPDVAAQANPRDVEVHALIERVEVRLLVLVEVPDVLPVAFGDDAVEGPTHLEQ